MFQPIRSDHVIVSTYSTKVPWSRDKSWLSIHIMWSISQSRDTKDRKLKAIKYSVHDTRHQEGYDEEELLHMQTTSGKEEQEDYEPEQDSWQISHLVSADTFGAVMILAMFGQEEWRSRDLWSCDNLWPVDCIQANKISHGGLWCNDRFLKVLAGIAEGAEIRV